MLFASLLLLLALSSNPFGASITLSTVIEFTNFIDNVNSGTANYYGTTVLLGTDLSFPDKTLDPIGKKTYYFRGTFDGQGHTISSLSISTSSQYTGLFGYSTGSTIRNLVLDSSCTITSSYSGSDYACVGGIIGYCNSENDQCNIENSVNMAGVTFGGSTDYNLFIGGVVGNIPSSSAYNSYMKNCANYGSVTVSGTVSDYTYLGGVVGLNSGSSSSGKYHYIQNCLNYGTLTHSGTSSNLIIGGIVGNCAYYVYIENCVSAGKVSTQATTSTTSYIGSIVGYVGSSNMYINYCYYTSDVGINSINGYGTPITTRSTNFTTNVSPDLVSKLNSNATSCNWNKWLLNANKATVTFKMGDDKELSFSSQVILVPEPVKEGNDFLFWCKDAECTEEFEAESVSGTTTLYAAWVNNIVSFDFDNGTTVNATFAYNTEIIYPEEEGYTLSWSNYHELMPAKDITVTAQWTPNNYIVTFDFDNGTTVNETFTYNTEIIYPDVKKEGYILSWDNYHEFMPAKNITVTAKWTPNNYTVSFDFDNGTTVNETFTYNTEIVYPKDVLGKEGYTLSWSNYHEFVPSGDITVTAQWTPNNYSVTFNANGGNISETSKMVTFNEKYGNLPEPKKEGHMFLGWFTNKTNGTEVTNETITTVPYNHTLYAHWEEVTTQVEIVFSKKDMTKEEIKEIIKQYTDADFEIADFEKSSGEIRAIIRFVDKEDAVEFVKNVKESNEMENIQRIAFDQDTHDSFSTTIYPLSFLSTIFL